LTSMRTCVRAVRLLRQPSLPRVVLTAETPSALGDRFTCSEPYERGVKKPEKTLKTPWGSVYEQVTSELESKPGYP
jgi:hypothetical protein